jgi:hypothetical protein
VWDASRAALVAALYLTFASYGCTRVAPRRSQLEGVSQAALRIKSSIGIGSYRLDRAVHEAQARCFARYGEEIRNASAVAQISIDDVEHKRPDNLLKRAADEIEQAERARAK